MLLLLLQGGKSFSSIADFMARFGVGDMQQSAEKVLDVINSQVRHPQEDGACRAMTAVCYVVKPTL